MERYGNWEVIESLGSGGQGTVYLARDTKSGTLDKVHLDNIKKQVEEVVKTFSHAGEQKLATLVAEAISVLSSSVPDQSHLGALKVLHAPSEQNGEYKKAKERMKREVLALSKINHPNVLNVLDNDIQNGWFVSEFHPDGPLSKSPLLYRGDVLGALTAFRPLVEGVAKLHESKIVHRDIKPHNVFLAHDKNLILGDLGLVFFTDDVHSRISDSYENVGSRDWMPAWAMGMRIEEIRPTFDVFCLGKLFWAMLSGRTLLRLWYHHEDQFELEKMFPEDESIKWARLILDKCIVEKERDCLITANELLGVVDEILPAVKRHGQVLAEGIVRRCEVCGLGFYKLTINEDTTGLHNFGISPAGMQTFKVFSCSHCGHVQMFHFVDSSRSRPKAWSR